MQKQTGLIQGFIPSNPLFQVYGTRETKKYNNSTVLIVPETHEKRKKGIVVVGVILEGEDITKMQKININLIRTDDESLQDRFNMKPINQ